MFVDKYNCCGCLACNDICPINALCVEQDEEGFLYPIKNYDICINCGLCDQVCLYKILEVKNISEF